MIRRSGPITAVQIKKQRLIAGGVLVAGIVAAFAGMVLHRDSVSGFGIGLAIVGVAFFITRLVRRSTT